MKVRTADSKTKITNNKLDDNKPVILEVETRGTEQPPMIKKQPIREYKNLLGIMNTRQREREKKINRL